MVDGDVHNLNEKADKSHDEKALSGGSCNLNELYNNMNKEGGLSQLSKNEIMTQRHHGSIPLVAGFLHFRTRFTDCL